MHTDLEHIPYLIYFDDKEKEPIVIIGYTNAMKTFEQISQSWNAHLFVKIASNSRDDPYSNSNIIIDL